MAKVSLGIKPPARDTEIGLSMPMNRALPEMSCVAVYSTKTAGLKFVHFGSIKYRGKYLVLLFMDNQLTDPEIQEWINFSQNLNKFKEENAVVVGVATASHVAIRSWLMKRMHGVQFPIISDNSGDISRLFGVLDVRRGMSARGLVILSPQMELLHHTINNEYTISDPYMVLSFIKQFKHYESESSRSIGADVPSEYTSLEAEGPSEHTSLEAEGPSEHTSLEAEGPSAQREEEGISRSGGPDLDISAGRLVINKVSTKLEEGYTTLTSAPDIELDANTQNPQAVPLVHMPLMMGEQPFRTQCPNCGNQVCTVTESRLSLVGWIIWGVLCIFGCWPCAFIPCCVDSLKEVKHYCPRCHCLIGTSKQDFKI